LCGLAIPAGNLVCFVLAGIYFDGSVNSIYPYESIKINMA
jgi:hypothetical protein